MCVGAPLLVAAGPWDPGFPLSPHLEVVGGGGVEDQEYLV